jgi:hypothetical protein
MNIRSTEHQAPSSREISISKLQLSRALVLEFENWSFPGAWTLELGAFKLGAFRK